MNPEPPRPATQGQVVLDLNSMDMNTLEMLRAEIQKRQQQQQIQQQIQAQLQRARPLQVLTPAPRPVEPTVTITEQPKARGLRFRYKCEGRSAGSIPGENSTNEHKTYPTIQINNFNGPAAIVVASCVTKDKPYQPHPHNLVGQDCKDGVCTIKVKGNSIVSFPNVGIQCCKRHDVDESLKKREQIRVDPFGTGYFNNVNNIDLNTVRLCFQVFLPDANKKFTHIVAPVVSQPIIDKKSIHDLVICRLSRQSGYANGGDEVFLLCEKINKDDIQVRFYQEEDDGVCWEAFGDFAAHDVHRQFAIVFRTPPYKDEYITSTVQVFIQLRRPSDEEFGDPKPFQYIPQDKDPYGIDMKRKRKGDVPITGYYNDRIPTSVLQDVKDEPDAAAGGASQDVRQRVKKKAERGMQQKKDKASASATGADTNDLQLYSNFFAGSASDTAFIQQAKAGMPQGIITFRPSMELGAATATTQEEMMTTINAARIAQGNNDPMMVTLSSTGELVLSSGDMENSQAAFMQYLHDNPTALTSMDSITLSGLSVSEFNISGVSAMEQQVSNDMNVGAQESVLDGPSGGATATQENGNGKAAVTTQNKHPLHMQ